MKETVNISIEEGKGVVTVEIPQAPRIKKYTSDEIATEKARLLNVIAYQQALLDKVLSYESQLVSDPKVLSHNIIDNV